ncbi:hypothetical protein NLJ89_g4417 [Agrocybe chaxingu]|uniref:Mitochondrial carrier n=1 Tax=Agrocybe chaxingu TaxID=84603 RepID=A0A9W8K0K4_9AGAR|nr:hypothetical protein NLJ89_g4417 [Agrocybe chaxingu]
MTSTLPPLVQAFSGAIGSAAANTLTYPLDLAITRLQLDSPRRSRERGGIKGARKILRHVLKKHGWEALYDGIVADTGATLLSNFFYFYFYSFLRSLSTRHLIPFRPKPPNSNGKPHKPTLAEELVLGFIAGIASRVISMPLNIVTLRLQTERGPESDSSDSESDSVSDLESPTDLGLVDVIKLIYKEQGLAGFWRGFQTTTILSLNPSITLACFQIYRRVLSFVKHIGPSSLTYVNKDGIKAAIEHAPASPNLKPWEAFFGAAISNSVAVAILYPLILAKVRLQASSSTTIREVLVDAYQGKDVLANDNTLDLHKEKSVDSEKSEVIGIQGLYQGLQTKIVKGFLSQGVTFLVKGR